jgi:hypothetical protein
VPINEIIRRNYPEPVFTDRLPERARRRGGSYREPVVYVGIGKRRAPNKVAASEPPKRSTETPKRSSSWPRGSRSIDGPSRSELEELVELYGQNWQEVAKDRWDNDVRTMIGHTRLSNLRFAQLVATKIGGIPPLTPEQQARYDEYKHQQHARDRIDQERDDLARKELAKIQSRNAEIWEANKVQWWQK